MPKKNPEYRSSGAEKIRTSDTRADIALGTRDKIGKVVPKKRNTESPAARTAKGTREKIKEIGLREQFEESEIGQEIIAGFGKLDKILNSEELLDQVTSMLSADADIKKFGSIILLLSRKKIIQLIKLSNSKNFDAILAFFILAAQRKPAYIKGHIAIPSFNRRLASAICTEMRWNMKELTKPKSGPAAKPATRKKSAETAKSHEALVAELEKTEIFRDDIINITLYNTIIAIARKTSQGRRIDWDGVIAELPQYSVKDLMAFLRKKRINVESPAISLKDIFSDPENLKRAIQRLEWDHNNVNPRHFGAFVLMATERNPKLVFDYFSKYRFAGVRDTEYRKVIVDMLKQKGFKKASVEMFKALPTQP